MNVTPIAFESMGVRSMATLVEADGKKVFIDPSAALGPSRFGLPPARQELNALEAAKNRIHDVALGSDVLVVTHYHYDHHDPDETFYKGKTVLAKDVASSINFSQRGRGKYFKEQVEGVCELRFADCKTFKFGGLTINFSPPFPHGPEGTKLGFVLMCLIDDGEKRFVFGSDVQGPISDEATEWVLECKPDIIVMDGPPTYLLGHVFSLGDFVEAGKNILRIIDETGGELILDHHLLRDLGYREKLRGVYDTGRVKSAAEYAGMQNVLLEAGRKALWKGVVPNYSMVPLRKGVKYE
ncbi:Uncharacterised protein [uncultured archaeon]|nr:Uncharacterised protein [uncultured archaeon]